MSGESRYLEWADRYGTVWARRIAAVEGRFPLLWTQDGGPVHEAEVAGQPIASAAGAGHHVAGDPLAGLENLLASGAIFVRPAGSARPRHDEIIRPEDER